jgi:uncharacterized protein (DUF2147 family)
MLLLYTFYKKTFAMKTLLFILALFVSTNAMAQTDKSANPNAVLHIWQTETKDGTMQILKDDTSYYGKMLYGKDLVEADGKTYKKDIHNPNPALRSRPLKEYTLISGLTYKDGKWTGGKLYYYVDGNSYDVNLEIKDSVLYMRVFKGMTMFGKTVKWTLVK